MLKRDEDRLRRDLFASYALAGLLANRDFHAFTSQYGDEIVNAELAASNAYVFADAMMAERARRDELA